MIGGTLSGPEEDFVVKVVSTAPTVIRNCTGTLIAPNLLVTAQHCVSNFDDGEFSCTNEGDLVAGGMYGQLGMLLSPEKVAVQIGSAPAIRDPPVAYGVQIFAPQTTTICKNDIAFIVLDRELEIPPAMVRFDRGVEPGELGRVVGYGETEDEYGVRYSRDGARIAAVGESSFRPQGGPTPPFTFATQGALLCIGDSGGPILAESGALLGVFSRFSGSCMSSITRNTFTQAAPFATAIAEEAFEAAGATPILEPPPGSGGTAGMPAEEGGAAGAGGEDTGTGGTGAGSGGSPQGGGTAGAGQAGSSGESARRGLRQRGGCRCDVPGTEQNAPASSMWTAAALLASVVLRRRWRG